MEFDYKKKIQKLLDAEINNNKIKEVKQFKYLGL